MVARRAGRVVARHREEPEARLGERHAGVDASGAEPLERSVVGAGSSPDVAGGERGDALAVARRGDDGAVVVGPPIATVGHERPPLRGEVRLVAPLGERSEQPRLGGHGLVQAELVEQSQALLDVAVCGRRVALEVGDHPAHVRDPAQREPVATALGERQRRVSEGPGAIELAERDGEDAVGDPHDGRPEVVAEAIERLASRRRPSPRSRRGRWPHPSTPGASAWTPARRGSRRRPARGRRRRRWRAPRAGAPRRRPARGGGSR